MANEPKTILLIDDDPDLQVGAAARLRAAGYVTTLANNGRQGVDAAIDTRPDAIVMDIRMPQCDGLEALRELKMREDTKDIPIIMLSACVAARQSALDQGAKYFISKPYEGRLLLAAIDSATSPQQCCRTETAVLANRRQSYAAF